MTEETPGTTILTEAIQPQADHAVSEAGDTEYTLKVADKAAGELASAQGWNCIGCGMTLAGGSGTITLATAVTVNRKPTGSIPVVIHDACLDDARWIGDLRDVVTVESTGAGSNDDTARKARVGAIVHAVAQARQLLACLPELNAEANKPARKKRAAPSTIPVPTRAPDFLPKLRGDGEGPGGATGGN